MTTTETSPATLPGSDVPVVRSHEGALAAPDIAGDLRRNWKLIVLPAIATMLIAWMITALQPKRYRASCIAAVTPVKQGLQPSEVLRSIEALDRRTIVATVASLATTPLTMSKVMNAAQASSYRLNPAVLPNTNLFRVDVEGPDPAAVADIANRIPAVVSTQTRAMFEVYGVTMVSAASRPTAPFAPRAGRAAAAGLVLGLIIGTALVYALHALRRRQALP